MERTIIALRNIYLCSFTVYSLGALVLFHWVATTSTLNRLQLTNTLSTRPRITSRLRYEQRLIQVASYLSTSSLLALILFDTRKFFEPLSFSSYLSHKMRSTFVSLCALFAASASASIPYFNITNAEFTDAYDLNSPGGYQRFGFTILDPNTGNSTYCYLAFSFVGDTPTPATWVRFLPFPLRMRYTWDV